MRSEFLYPLTSCFLLDFFEDLLSSFPFIVLQFWRKVFLYHDRIQPFRQHFAFEMLTKWSSPVGWVVTDNANSGPMEKRHEFNNRRSHVRVDRTCPGKCAVKCFVGYFRTRTHLRKRTEHLVGFIPQRFAVSYLHGQIVKLTATWGERCIQTRRGEGDRRKNELIFSPPHSPSRSFSMPRLFCPPPQSSIQAAIGTWFSRGSICPFQTHRSQFSFIKLSTYHGQTCTEEIPIHCHFCWPTFGRFRTRAYFLAFTTVALL